MKRFLFIISTVLLLMACGNSAADEFLDSYERFADRYVLCMKNLKNGNSDEQDLKDMLGELQELQMKAAEVEGKFTKEQKMRYVKITQTMYAPAMDSY